MPAAGPLRSRCMAHPVLPFIFSPLTLYRAGRRSTRPCSPGCGRSFVAPSSGTFRCSARANKRAERVFKNKTAQKQAKARANRGREGQAQADNQREGERYSRGKRNQIHSHHRLHLELSPPSCRRPLSCHPPRQRNESTCWVSQHSDKNKNGRKQNGTPPPRNTKRARVFQEVHVRGGSETKLVKLAFAASSLASCFGLNL